MNNYDNNNNSGKYPVPLPIYSTYLHVSTRHETYSCYHSPGVSLWFPVPTLTQTPPFVVGHDRVVTSSITAAAIVVAVAVGSKLQALIQRRGTTSCKNNKQHGGDIHILPLHCTTHAAIYPNECRFCWLGRVQHYRRSFHWMNEALLSVQWQQITERG